MFGNLPSALLSVVCFGVVTPNEPLPDARAVEFVDMPASFVGIARWAIELFDEAQLELPAIRFVFHGDDDAPCGGPGATHRSVGGLSTVELCVSDADAVAEAIVLHEVAHAWAAHDLDGVRRDAFQSLRGWSEWLSAHQPWHENGSEQAADIIVWGVIDRPIGIVRLLDNSCDDLEAGYRTLTGQPPPHGYRDHC